MNDTALQHKRNLLLEVEMLRQRTAELSAAVNAYEGHVQSLTEMCMELRRDFPTQKQVEEGARQAVHDLREEFLSAAEDARRLIRETKKQFEARVRVEIENHIRSERENGRRASA